MTIEQIGGRPACICGGRAFEVFPGERWPDRNEYELECSKCGALMLWRDPMPLAEVLIDSLGGFEAVGS
jgi:hypothetical protein